MSVRAPDKKIRFGVFELDEANGELRKSGIRIRLQDQPFKILVALLESPGEVVTRDELRHHVWGEDTFVDFEHGLSAAVNRLREALNDSADTPRFIETVPRRGYRFLAPVEHVGLPETSEPAEARQPKPASEQRRRSRILRFGGLAACLVVALVASWLWLNGHRSSLPPNRVAQITSFPGVESHPALSPDGRQVAFNWDGGQSAPFDVYVMAVGSTTSLRLTTNPAPDLAPAWSPDGSLISFVRLEGGVATLYLVPPLGGTERKFVEYRPTSSPHHTWSPDGRWIALARRDEDGARSIVAVNVASGRQLQLATSSNEVLHGPAFSPNGRWLAYACCRTGFSCMVHVLELTSDLRPQGKPRIVSGQPLTIHKIEWTPDGRSLVFSGTSDIANYPYLWRATPFNSRELERLELAGPRAICFTVAPVGNRLAYSRWTNADFSDIWKWSSTSGLSRFIASTRSEGHPQFSNDGKRVAFSSRLAGGNNEIFVCNRDGSELLQLTDGIGRSQGSPTWSPDGRQLAFDTQTKDGRFDVYLIDPAGGPPRQLTDDPGDEAIPSFSRDGRWVYFLSNRGGTRNIWKIPVEGGDWVQVTTSGGRTCRESWDGKALFYMNETGDSTPTVLYSKSLSGGDEQEILRSVLPRAFFPVEDGIYFIERSNRSSDRLKFWKFADKTSHLLADLGGRATHSISASPDGEVLFTLYNPENADLMLIENFR